MRSSKRDFPEGTWFSVPLRNGGFAQGVVARTTGEGVVFGYFFGPKADSVEALAPRDDLTVSDAVLVGKFGDRGFIEGTWSKLSNDQNWSRSQWPMTPFIRVDEVAGSACLSTYDDDFNLLSDEPCDPTLADKHPRDSLMGYGSVEIKLTRLLDLGEADGMTPVIENRPIVGAEQPSPVWHYIYFPTEEAGKAVAQSLTAKGFAVEDRLAADEVNWLVLAKHRIVPTDEALHQLRSALEALAAKYGGEYDGWEVAS